MTFLQKIGRWLTGVFITKRASLADAEDVRAQEPQPGPRPASSREPTSKPGSKHESRSATQTSKRDPSSATHAPSAPPRQPSGTSTPRSPHSTSRPPSQRPIAEPKAPPRADAIPRAEDFVKGDQWPQDSALLPWYDQNDWPMRLERIKAARNLGIENSTILRSWCQEGSVIVRELIDVHLIDALIGEVDRMWESDVPIDGLAISTVDLEEADQTHVTHLDLVKLRLARRRRIREISNWRISQLHRYSELARRIFEHPRIGDIATTIFGSASEPRYSLMLAKGTEQQLGQDSCMFHVFPRDFMLGVYVACEDVTPTSGPFVYYAGSHRAPLFREFDNYPQTNRRTSDPAQSKRYDEFISAQAVSYPRLELILRKGDVLFWHPMLIYGNSVATDTSATRLSFITHHFAVGADVHDRIKGPINW